LSSLSSSPVAIVVVIVSHCTVTLCAIAINLCQPLSYPSPSPLLLIVGCCVLGLPQEVSREESLARSLSQGVRGDSHKERDMFCPPTIPRGNVTCGGERDGTVTYVGIRLSERDQDKGVWALGGSPPKGL
jgi:hypothetical protein